MSSDRQGEFEATVIRQAIHTLTQLSAPITAVNVWIILDLQGIADDITDERIAQHLHVDTTKDKQVTV